MRRCGKAARGGRHHYRQDQHARARLRHLRLQRRVQDRHRDRACATPMTRPRSPVARRPERGRRSARASSPRGSAPTPAGRSGFPARSTAAPRCVRPSAAIRRQGIAPISHTRDTAGPMASTMADVAMLDRIIAGGGAVAPADLKQVRIGIVNRCWPISIATPRRLSAPRSTNSNAAA